MKNEAKNKQKRERIRIKHASLTTYHETAIDLPTAVLDLARFPIL
jgi:hypothetical protein